MTPAGPLCPLLCVVTLTAKVIRAKTTLARTRHALPSIALDGPRVLLRELVAVRAMSLPRVLSGRTNAASNVHARRYGFKVEWIATTGISAQMVELKFVWDASDEEHIGEAMRVNLATIESDLAVPERSLGPEPRPAVGLLDAG
jgi:hypothetical protein